MRRWIITYIATQEGLQKCLDELKVYLDAWGLELNLKKSSAVNFSKRGRTPNYANFTIGYRDLNLLKDRNTWEP